LLNKEWSLTGRGDDENYDNTQNYYWRFFFDFMFFILINVIMLNLVFGIIINTFSGIRDEKFANKED